MDEKIFEYQKQVTLVFSSFSPIPTEEFIITLTIVKIQAINCALL